jgi:branched-chain amino acid transport system ATP-binding protein/branched-chain amino acid transport system permease protein
VPATLGPKRSVFSAAGTRYSTLIVLWIVGLVVLVSTTGPGPVSDSIVFIFIFGVIAVGYDAVIGMSGQLALGQNGLVALGGYAAGLTAVHLTGTPVVGAVISAAAGGLGAIVVALIAFRLREFYFAIFTLASGILVGLIATAWRPVTGGNTGLGPLPGMLGGNIVQPNYHNWMILTGSSLLVALVVALLLRNSKVGRIWRTIARDEQLARAFGVDTRIYKLLAFGFGGILAGYGGFLIARYTQYVSPDIFGVVLALHLILMVFLGGRGTAWGPCLGSAVVYGLNRYLSDHGDYADIVLGGIFIVVLMAAPYGLVGMLGQLKRAAQLGRRRTRSGPPKVPLQQPLGARGRQS